MKKLFVLALLPFLSACGGETYPVPLTTAYQTLTTIGTPSSLTPMTMTMKVASTFQASPGDSRVEWRFTTDGKEIGRVHAMATADGDTASKVQVWYEEGSAADEGDVAKARPIIRDKLQRVLADAVDSKMEKRPPDADLAQQMQVQVATAYVGSMMKEASASFDEEIARRQQDKMESAYRSQANTANATKPSTDLSKYQ